MENVNMAYDLSLYDREQERHIARKTNKRGKIIKAQTKFAFTKKVGEVLGVAVILSLVVALIATNAATTNYAAKTVRINNEITQLESEKAYLDFTLESRMSLDEIETYAVNNLGMVKMGSEQKVYVELEDENKIRVTGSGMTDKVTQAVEPILSYLVP